MLRRCFAVFALAASSWAHAEAPPPDTDSFQVGSTVRTFSPTQVREWRGAKRQALVTRIWYPVERSGQPAQHDIGPTGHPLFRGSPVSENAPLSAAHETYPLVVFSHGTGGSADELDWLASAFAKHGYIVAGVNHPGNNALEPLTREGFVLWWERATDLSEVLDAMLADKAFGPHIDPRRVGAAGFSLGGYTVLELAGARTDLSAFRAYCHSPAADSNCHPPTNYASRKVAPMSASAIASMKRSGASYRDLRIKAVFAMAPAIGKALDQQSLTRIEIPVRLIAGTADTTAPPTTNVLHIAQFLPRARVRMIDGATHYTFLDTCVPAAMTIHATICKEAPGVDRDAVHAIAIGEAFDFFDSSLAVPITEKSK